MTGCLYELDGQVKAYPNIDRLLKKYPNAKIIKEIEDVSSIDRELLKYKGLVVKDKIKAPEENYEYEYRLNVNTVLCAHNKDDFEKLKRWYNIND